jgi:hypothetical protein
LQVSCQYHNQLIDECVEAGPKPPSLFSVSYPPNPQFVGRTEILELIHTHLDPDAKPGFTASFALHGLGGVGKTQIAIRYAYLHQKDFDIIYWLRANDIETLITSYIELSRNDDLILLGAPKVQDEDNKAIVKRLKRWFEMKIGSNGFSFSTMLMRSMKWMEP